jgi:hypothetical protein
MVVSKLKYGRLAKLLTAGIYRYGPSASMIESRHAYAHGHWSAGRARSIDTNDNNVEIVCAEPLDENLSAISVVANAREDSDRPVDPGDRTTAARVSVRFL